MASSGTQRLAPSAPLVPLKLSRVQLAWLGGVLATLGVGHIVIARGTHLAHVIHLSLVAFYLAPLIAAVLWAGLRGGVVGSLLVTTAFTVHVRLGWKGQLVELPAWWSFVSIFWVVGVVGGVLVDLQRAERVRALLRERSIERRNVIEAMASLAAALGSHDPYTQAHGERVREVAAALGKELRMDPEQIEVLRLAGLVHDIGKLGVPDDILLKPGDLSEAERSSVEKHPETAAAILGPLRGAANVADIVLSHHECPDGSGYPRGLRNPEIPLEAHILRVADIFCSLRDTRPYKPALPVSKVLGMMEGMAGTKLDPTSFHALECLVQRGEPQPA